MTFIYYRMQRYLHNLAGDVLRAKRPKRLKRVLITSAVAGLLLMVIVAVTFSGIGAVSTVEARNVPAYDISDISGSTVMAQDAQVIAAQLYGNRPESETYREQLLTAYNESLNYDIVILFNSGGWGTKQLQNSADWTSIVNGIQYELSQSGYRVVTLNYQRTIESVPGQLNELKEMITGYPDKAIYLAQLANFLTSYLPGITVILAGESTGTIICDSTMQLLKDNDRVYSIQTGSPCWHNGTSRERTLLVNDNGITQDAFSHGDVSTIVRSSLVSLIELKRPDLQGEILGFISAPGHEYWWQYPGVSSKIESFLSRHFGILPEIQSTN